MTQKINTNSVWAAVAAIAIVAMTGCNQQANTTAERFSQLDTAAQLAHVTATNESPLLAFSDTPTSNSRVFVAIAPFVSPLGAGDSLGQQVFIETPARFARGQQNYEQLWREMAEVETGY